jgi:hypothetical protein
MISTERCLCIDLFLCSFTPVRRTVQPQQLVTKWGAENRGHTPAIGLVHFPSEFSLYQLRSNLFITARARP